VLICGVGCRGSFNESHVGWQRDRRDSCLVSQLRHTSTPKLTSNIQYKRWLGFLVCYLQNNMNPTRRASTPSETGSAPSQPYRPRRSSVAIGEQSAHRDTPQRSRREALVKFTQDDDDRYTAPAFAAPISRAGRGPVEEQHAVSLGSSPRIVEGDNEPAASWTNPFQSLFHSRPRADSVVSVTSEVRRPGLERRDSLYSDGDLSETDQMYDMDDPRVTGDRNCNKRSYKERTKGKVTVSMHVVRKQLRLQSASDSTGLFPP